MSVLRIILKKFFAQTFEMTLKQIKKIAILLLKFAFINTYIKKIFIFLKYFKIKFFCNR